MRLCSILVMNFIFSVSAFAYTFNNNFSASFGNDKVKILIAEDTTCFEAGLTTDELIDLIKPAIKKFWNTVPTSALRLKYGGIASRIGNDINVDRLCAPTDNPCIDNAGGPLIPPVKNILIACNNNALNFPTTSILAVTVPNHFSGSTIKGSVILINDRNGTAFADLSKSDQISVIAHEIGHAIGLGHSDDSAALMYYRTVDHRSKLGQDDVDGVSYLYPIHGDAYGCTSIAGLIKNKSTHSHKGDDHDDDNQSPPYLPMAVSMVSMIVLFEFVRVKFRKENYLTSKT